MAKSNINRYLEKSVLYPPFLKEPVHPELNMIIVIPCFNEDELLITLNSVYSCDAPKFPVEVLVVINEGQDASRPIIDRNNRTNEDMLVWGNTHNSERFGFYPIRVSGMPRKFAGVGLARKIGMDEAVRRFASIGNEDGVIVCLDADSQVETNYLQAIEQHFENHIQSKACAIHYEHPISGRYEDSIYDSIAQYELHLRYFIDQQKRLDLPFAYQTVGSSMAVRLEAYCSLGGMNRRKAGEDFYFFHKFVKLGKVTELYSTKVVPSPRISDRVPFGTGKAVGDMMDNPIFMTYHPDSFKVLGDFLSRIKPAYQSKSIIEMTGLQKDLISFFDSINLDTKWDEAVKNTSDWKSFYKRFFHWFDAFLFMKYLHHMRDAKYQNLPILEAVQIAYPDLLSKNVEDFLLEFRMFR